MLPCIVALFKIISPTRIQGTNWLGQISVVAGLAEVEFSGFVIGQNPREDRVLVQVVVSASGNGVEEHEVFEVGHLPALPLESHVGVAHELAGRHHGGPPGLWDAVLDAHAHARQRLDDLLHRIRVREGEHDGSSAREEDLDGRVLEEEPPGEDGAHLGEVPLAVQVVAVLEHLCVQLLVLGVLLVHLEVELGAGDGHGARGHDARRDQLRARADVDGTGQVNVEVAVVCQELAVVQKVGVLHLLLLLRHGAGPRGRHAGQVRVELLAGLQDGVLGGAVLQGRLERGLRVAGAAGVVHEALAPARVVLPRVQLPELAQHGALRVHVAPGAVLVGQDVAGLLQQAARDHVVPAARGCDEVVAHALLLAPLQQRLRALRLEVGVLKDVVGAHPVQDELGLVGHAHDVVLHGVRQQPAFVDELDEGQPRVLLQRVLPLL